MVLPSISNEEKFVLSDLVNLSAKTYELASKFAPGVEVIVRQLTFADLGYTGPAGSVSLPAGPGTVSTVLASGVVTGNQVITLYGFVYGYYNSGNANLPTLYIDIYVGGRRVQRWDISYLVNYAINYGNNPTIFFYPDEPVFITPNQSYSVVVVIYNPNNTAIGMQIELVGLVGEPNGKTIYYSPIE